MHKTHIAAIKRLEQLQTQIVKVRQKMLRSLPAEYGYRSADELHAAIKEAEGAAAAPATEVVKPGKPPRARITPALRQKIVGLLKEGRTIKAVSILSKVSVQSVFNIKKAEGLTNPAKDKKPAAPALPAAPTTKAVKKAKRSRPAKRAKAPKLVLSAKPEDAARPLKAIRRH